MTETVKRPVEFVLEKDSPIGLWHINCPTCPKHAMEDAVETKRSACVSGMSTNMQGAIPMNHCKHKRNREWAEPLEVECAFQLPKSQRA